MTVWRRDQSMHGCIWFQEINSSSCTQLGRGAGRILVNAGVMQSPPAAQRDPLMQSPIHSIFVVVVDGWGRVEEITYIHVVFILER